MNMLSHSESDHQAIQLCSRKAPKSQNQKHFQATKRIRIKLNPWRRPESCSFFCLLGSSSTRKVHHQGGGNHWHLSTQLCSLSLTPVYKNSAAMVMDALFCCDSWTILPKKTKRVSLENKNKREKNQLHIPRIVDFLSESCDMLLTVSLGPV